MTILVPTIKPTAPPVDKQAIQEPAPIVEQQVEKPQPEERTVKPEKAKPVQEKPKPVAEVEPVEPVEVVTPPPTPVDPGSNRAIGQELAAARGWTGDQWNCLDQLWQRESGWRHTVANYEGSGAYGIPQSLPASKMASHGADYLTNPTTQIRWGIDYISSRYQTPCGALAFHDSNNWY